jgi:hypothetical protein
MVFCAWLYEETVATVLQYCVLLSLHLRQNGDRERGTATDTRAGKWQKYCEFLVNVKVERAFPHMIVETEK